ncbi:sensor histidine kinase [Aquiflexum lacus]|uniref:sensor histidine kinase n=1 Tax=Aquiflexum lacus TaxID=2483805 RepID=UPI001E4C9C93|nr:histidine kinase N-terminal 7TM domain-containing protein [Aquiflexum lacus]
MNIFSITLLVSGILVAGISSVIIYRMKDAVRWFAVTMLLVAIWALGYGLELMSETLEAMLFWVKIEYVGIALAPGTWIWFCLKYTGLEKWLNFKTALVVFAIPIITFLIILTNEFHHLHYKEVSVYDLGPFPLLEISIGPWYLVHTTFFYLSLLFGNILLLIKFKNADSIYRKQINLLIFAGVVPWFFNVIYLLGYRPFEHIDLTPYAFLFTYIFIGIALLRFELFNIKPIARDKVFELITKGILVFDPNEKVIDYNHAILKALKKPKDKLIGKSMGELFENKPELIAVIQKREICALELELDSDTNKSEFRIECVPILDKKDIFSGMMVLFENISAEKKTQRQLQYQADELIKTNSLKDKLFTIISHDLKGPILGVRELIRLTNEGVIGKDEFFKILPEVNKNMDSVSILLENLLAWTSSQLKGEVVEKQEFNLEELLQEQFKLFDKTVNEKGIFLKKVKYSQGDIVVFADKNMIDLAIRNLISNAIKFSGLGDTISVILKEKPESVYIRIKDTGSGIPPENLDKLRRKESISTLGKNKESGTGLGLLLVQDYIEKNGGHLYIQSTLNEGSEFSFYLPKK